MKEPEGNIEVFQRLREEMETADIQTMDRNPV